MEIEGQGRIYHSKSNSGVCFNVKMKFLREIISSKVFANIVHGFTEKCTPYNIAAVSHSNMVNNVPLSPAEYKSKSKLLYD
jgi:hypothetical protein